MSKVTIAAAVIAGMNIAKRLEHLQVRDDVLMDLVGELADSLANLLEVTALVDESIGLVADLKLREQEDFAMAGLAHIKAVTSELVSDQDKIRETFYESVSDEERLILELLSALQGR